MEQVWLAWPTPAPCTASSKCFPHIQRNRLPYGKKTEQLKGKQCFLFFFFLLNYWVIIILIITRMSYLKPGVQCFNVDEHLSSLKHSPRTFRNTNESPHCQVNPTIFHTWAEFLSLRLCGHSSCLLISTDALGGGGGVGLPRIEERSNRSSQSWLQRLRKHVGSCRCYSKFVSSIKTMAVSQTVGGRANYMRLQRVTEEWTKEFIL